MLTPFPTQLSGAEFLANRQHALLADEPRCGKTGTAIMAADYNLDDSILVVTTASGRPVWNRAFADWSEFDRSVQIVTSAKKVTAQVAIVGWPSIANPQLRAELLKRNWDRLILDESHAAKNFDTRRTQAAYGAPMEDGHILLCRGALANASKGVWCLSGTPLPHDPSDIYPMMRALCAERLSANPSKAWPDVTKYGDFLHRYCVVRMKKLPRGFQKIPVVIGGKNLDELRARLEGFILRRTQQDVGIREPIYETLPLAVSDRMSREAEGCADRSAILAAAKAGDTKALEMHLGPLRRMTGELKAKAVVAAVKDEFDGGLDKIVIAYWHRAVGDILEAGLAEYNPVRLDGSTPAAKRGEHEQRFLHDPTVRVFVGQIQAAGEAIDLSSAATLWFAESSFVPKDMAQMSKRITNYGQTRQCFVRVCVLESSIDEAINEILIRLWASIKGVLS
jgi:SWI/SNF-related matrix-associated actin-dependent regulator 1 of chromatin subfamily A